MYAKQHKIQNVNMGVKFLYVNPGNVAIFMFKNMYGRILYVIIKQAKAMLRDVSVAGVINSLLFGQVGKWSFATPN